ncbi:Uncharacterised protein [Klebsiella oxytoca]|nr:Uncharacterised protein [Klebsiella oxytoca]
MGSQYKLMSWFSMGKVSLRFVQLQQVLLATLIILSHRPL